MVVEFKTEDQQEIKRLSKVNDLCSFIFELVNNSHREFKHTDYDYQPYRDKIFQLLEEHNINIDDLYT